MLFQLTLCLDLAWHTHMLHPYHYRAFTSKCVGKFLNHDDTIPEAELEQYVELTNDAWQFRNNPHGFRHSLKKTVNTILLKNMNKGPVVYIDGRIPNREETLFQGYYNTGGYEPTPTDNVIPSESMNNTKKSDIVGDHYDKNNTSFHDKRKSDPWLV
jgi:hypothetical protein